MKALAAAMILISIVLTQLEMVFQLGGDFISGFTLATLFVVLWAFVGKAREVFAGRGNRQGDDQP